MKGERAKTFGEFFKSRRMALGYTLRRFCVEKGLDPANISNLERGEMPPPQKREKLEEYARHLKIKKGSTEWYEFFDLARIAQGRIPEDLLKDSELVKRLPLLCRTTRGERLSKEQLKELIKLVKGD
jgi:transcriptional regulator with XRE-family HTH domain